MPGIAHGIFLQETEISGATTISRIANSAVNAAAVSSYADAVRYPLPSTEEASIVNDL
jgi:hypothetical protein